jgi:CheY-like chemotaxis protein/flagellar basal body-associated protein FliL
MNSSSISTTLFFSEVSDIYLIALISILLIALVFIYLYFTSKLSKQKIEFRENATKAKERETNQNALLSNLSDNIYNLTKDKGLEGEILISTNNLRELLKIQANKIEQYQEKFTFSHMLDDVVMYLSSNFSRRNTELIFTIDDNIPQYLTGDVIHFSRIINNILEYAIQSTPKGKVTLSIESMKPIGDKVILDIKIKDGARGFSDEQVLTLFDLVYDEKSNEQKGLHLYIAKKLTLSMGGTIEVQRDMASGNTFSLQLPMYLNEESNVKAFSAFKKDIEQKKVLICSEKPATALSLEQCFKYFYEEVYIAKREELDKRKINLMDFDLLILDDAFFNTTNNEHLKLIKGNKDIYIVACNSIFTTKKQEENTLMDSSLQTPTNLAHIVTIITEIESKNTIVEKSLEEVAVPVNKNDGTLLVYKDSIAEMPNIDIDCFTYFKGAKLLIVEDNLINQKIIVSVLKKSGMDIDIANNGQEALDLLFIERKRYDIVLMDISMPIMDGLIATERIRERHEFDMMPIVTFTAFAMGTEIEQMFMVGGNAYLTKPLNIKKLYSIFNMFLAQEEREVSLQKTIEIEGLDVKKGIALADESEALYKETLKEFVLVYKDMEESIPRWIKEKHYERVKLACNDIQGILDAIGAYELKELVDEIQKNFLYQNEDFLDNYILLYPQKHHTLMEAIEHYLDV